jgi:AraC family transcriptional regulator
MQHAESTPMKLDAELSVAAATVWLARFHFPQPIEHIKQEVDAYWLDHCLTPRPADTRACYRERWSPHRFERIGDVFVVPPGESLHTRSNGGAPQTSIVCQLKPEPLRAWCDDDLEWTGRRLEATLDVSSANIRALLLRLAEEARHPGFASSILVELIIGQIGIELARYCRTIIERPAAGGLAPWRLRLIEERFVEERDAPTLSELAGLCGVSVRQLTRGFRVSRGCSIGEYIAERRIAHARQSLLGGESIKAIAYSLGFATPSSFCYAFRKATGETPRQFTQKMTRTHQ